MSTVYYGDDTNDPSGITIPSDGQGPIKAADVNPAVEGIFDKIATLRANVRLVDVLNFPYSKIESGPRGAAAWHPFKNQWVFALKYDSTHFRFTSWDGTENPNVAYSVGAFVISAGTSPVGLAVHPTNDVAIATVNDSGGGPNYYVYRWEGGAAASKSVPTAGGTSTGAGIVWFGGQWVAIAKHGGGTPTHEIATSPDGDTWTYRNSPAAFSAAHDAPLMVAQSPTVCLAFPQNASHTEDGTVPYTRCGEYLRTTDGVTWTKYGPTWIAPSGSFPSGIFWSGLTYDAKRELFVAVGVGTDGDDNMMVWTSPDGLTWTYAGTKVLGARPYGIAAHDGTWIVPVVGIHGSDRERAYSTDAGVTWFVIRGGWEFDGALTGSMMTTPISNGHQVLIASDTGAFASIVSRPSSYELQEYTP